MVEAINAMPTQRSKAWVWNIHVVFEPPTPPASRPAQRPHGRCFTLEAPSGSSVVMVVVVVIIVALLCRLVSHDHG